MTPLDRLLAEDIPTRPPAKPPREPWTPDEQAEHVAALLAALDGWTYDRDHRITVDPTDPPTPQTTP